MDIRTELDQLALGADLAHLVEFLVCGVEADSAVVDFAEPAAVLALRRLSLRLATVASRRGSIGILVAGCVASTPDALVAPLGVARLVILSGPDAVSACAGGDRPYGGLWCAVDRVDRGRGET